MEKTTTLRKLLHINQDGRVGVPILLLLCGTPVGIVFLLWLFVFRGH